MKKIRTLFLYRIRSAQVEDAIEAENMLYACDYFRAKYGDVLIVDCKCIGWRRV